MDVERLAGDPPSSYETEYGFARTVRAGNWVMVGGTTSIGPAGSVIGETPAEQAAEILGRIEHELGRAGCSLADVVQTRVYVTDIGRAEEVGQTFGEVFRPVRPLMTMVEVSGLIDPRLLVEIEAVAWLPAP
jgi:enamine deaminase RidA (YjgF/YER057c/UK114 family)